MMIMNTKFSLLAVAFVALASTSVVASPTGGVGGIQKRHQHVARAQQNQNSSSNNVNYAPVARGNGKKRRATGKAARCAAKSSSSAAAAVESTTSKADATTTKEQPTSTSTRHTTTTTKTSATPKATPKTSDDDDGGSGSNSSDDPYSGDGTYYGVGNNACGGIDHEPDMIAAVAHGFFDSFPGATANPNLNPICGKSLTATYQGRSVVVKITDKCMGCVTQALDFSEAAFKVLTGGSLTAGRIHGVTWHWN